MFGGHLSVWRPPHPTSSLEATTLNFRLGGLLRTCIESNEEEKDADGPFFSAQSLSVCSALK